MVRKIRRLVTGLDDDGKSAFIMDGDAESVLVLEGMGGLALTELWETQSAPADNTGSADHTERPMRLEPARQGTVFRMVEFPPDSAWKETADPKAVFEAMGAGHAAVAGHDDPGMHKTASVDYALVLEGEIWAVLETGERLMKQGDVLIQRGTTHAWSNRTADNCLMMFVLCGAEPI